MALLPITQKKPIQVTKSDGTVLTSGWTGTIDDTGVCTFADNGFYVAAVALGTTTMHLTAEGESGSLEITVTENEGELVITLGPGVPK